MPLIDTRRLVSKAKARACEARRNVTTGRGPETRVLSLVAEDEGEDDDQGQEAAGCEDDAAELIDEVVALEGGELAGDARERPLDVGCVEGAGTRTRRDWRRGGGRSGIEAAADSGRGRDVDVLGREDRAAARLLALAGLLRDVGLSRSLRHEGIIEGGPRTDNASGVAAKPAGRSAGGSRRQRRVETWGAR